MPNKRAKHKTIMTSWIETEDHDEFENLAKQLGYTKSELINKLIREELKRNGIKTSEEK